MLIDNARADLGVARGVRMLLAVRVCPQLACLCIPIRLIFCPFVCSECENDELHGITDEERHLDTVAVWEMEPITRKRSSSDLTTIDGRIGASLSLQKKESEEHGLRVLVVFCVVFCSLLGFGILILL